jgi:hypothetical protein
MNRAQQRIIGALRWRVAEARERQRQRYLERQKLKNEIILTLPEQAPLPRLVKIKPPPVLPEPPPPPPPPPSGPVIDPGQFVLGGRIFIDEGADLIRCSHCYVGFRLTRARNRMLQWAVSHACFGGRVLIGVPEKTHQRPS